MMTPLSPEMTVAELLASASSAGTILARQGMACVGCPMARFETVGEAAAAYGKDPQVLLSEIGKCMRAKGAQVRRT